MSRTRIAAWKQEVKGMDDLFEENYGINVNCPWVWKKFNIRLEMRLRALPKFNKVMLPEFCVVIKYEIESVILDRNVIERCSR